MMARLAEDGGKMAPMSARAQLYHDRKLLKNAYKNAELFCITMLTVADCC
jgi:hypothetical protein